MAVPGTWAAMVHAIRNLGRPGIISMAIAAVDAALWDLKARLLDLPLGWLTSMFARRLYQLATPPMVAPQQERCATFVTAASDGCTM